MEPGSFSDDEQEKTSLSPPYISFLMFTNCLEWLKSEGVPYRFDRSFWSRKYSGSVGPQLLTALRFLGLLQNNTPLPTLEELVSANDADRKRLLAAILKNSYKEVDFALLGKATSGMLREWMSKYPTIQGTTQQKAMSFLINGLKYVGIPLSPALVKSARNKPAPSTSPSSSNRSTRKPKPATDTSKTPEREEEKPGSGDDQYSIIMRQLHLESGGEVNLKIKVNLFDLSEGDREFVMRLVDAFRDYQVNFTDENEEDEEE